MAHLGIVRQNDLDDDLIAFFKEKNDLVTVVSQEAINKLNGLIITITDKSQINGVLERLIKMKNGHSFFVWIYSQIPLEYEREMMMMLGANDVVMGEESFHYFTSIVENGLKTVELISQPHTEKDEKKQLLNEKNQSILINGKEVGLTRKEYQLFSILYENRNQCISYEKLNHSLWAEPLESQKYLLANLIFHLREKMKNEGVIDIKNVRSKGYLLRIT